MGEQVEKYGEALAAYTESARRVSALVNDLNNFHSAINNRLDGFLQETYGVSLGVRSASGPVKFTMDNWPSKDDIDGAFGAFARNFNALRHAWANLSEADKAYLKAPPTKPELIR